jgi:hypothetical protein
MAGEERRSVVELVMPHKTAGDAQLKAGNCRRAWERCDEDV